MSDSELALLELWRKGRDADSFAEIVARQRGGGDRTGDASASGSGAASPPLPSRKGKLSACIKGRRPAFSLLKKKFVPFTVYDRLKLFPGAKMPGPAILEEKESTIVIGEDAAGRVDEFGFVWIDLN